MNKMEKMTDFEEVREFLAEIPSIHMGGCGVAALAMYKWLQKNDQLRRFRFVACYTDDQQDNEFKTNKKVLKQKKGEAKAMSHIGILHNGKVIDCKESIDLTRYELLQFVEAENEWFIANMINNIGSWNTSFSRSNIRQIEKVLDVKLNIKEK